MRATARATGMRPLSRRCQSPIPLPLPLCALCVGRLRNRCSFVLPERNLYLCRRRRRRRRARARARHKAAGAQVNSQQAGSAHERRGAPVHLSPVHPSHSSRSISGRGGCCCGRARFLSAMRFARTFGMQTQSVAPVAAVAMCCVRQLQRLVARPLRARALARPAHCAQQVAPNVGFRCASRARTWAERGRRVARAHTHGNRRRLNYRLFGGAGVVVGAVFIIIIVVAVVGGGRRRAPNSARKSVRAEFGVGAARARARVPNQRRARAPPTRPVGCRPAGHWSPARGLIYARARLQSERQPARVAVAARKGLLVEPVVVFGGRERR